MLYNLKSVNDADVSGKTVLLRADLDVPISPSSQIQDDSRLNSWFPTLELLVQAGAKVIIVGHLGRPEGADENFTLKPVADWIAAKLGGKVNEAPVGDFKAWKINDSVSLLQNIRFYKEEEENNQEFARKLSSIAQIYVNDAFATAHRAHASTEGVTHFLDSFAGLRILTEVKVLSKVIENPDRPMGVIIGGAKLETKMPLVEKMHALADSVLVGGTVMGNREMIDKINSMPTATHCSLLIAEPVPDKMDVTVESMRKFLEALANDRTIVWNGPFGKIEDPKYQTGTLALAEGIIKIPAYTIVGGGDTTGFLKTKGLIDKFSFVSVGGGAMLEFLSGDRLPGLLALEQK